MTASAWLIAASTEAAALADQAALDAGDRWRLCVLVARLLGSSGVTPPATALKRAASEVGSILPPEPDVLLEALSTSLRSGDDACAGLFDALLDIDDAIAVTVLTGSDGRELTLVHEAAALVSIWPERCLPLSEFAAMRLETIRGDAPIRRLWAEVAASPASVLAEALSPTPTPGLRHPKRVRQSPPPPRAAPGVTRQVSFPRATLEARAWTQGDAVELGDDAWLSEENGRLHLEVRGATAATVVVIRERDGTALIDEPVAGRVKGRTFHGDLGLATGEESLFRRLLTRAQVRADEVSLVLRFSRG